MFFMTNVSDHVITITGTCISEYRQTCTFIHVFVQVQLCMDDEDVVVDVEVT